MDGFPNGRRLEDDVTRIELQAVSGIVLAAIGLWYDDYNPSTSPSPVTPQLLNVLTYNAGVTANDTSFKTVFPFVQTPWAGTYNCNCETPPADRATNYNSKGGQLAVENKSTTLLLSPDVIMKTSPNPFMENTIIQYRVKTPAQITIDVFDAQGKQVKTLMNKKMNEGNYFETFNVKSLNQGIYFVKLSKNGVVQQTLKVIKN